MKKVCVCVICSAILLLMCACGESFGWNSENAAKISLDGTWRDLAGAELIISNYSKEAFDLTWGGKTTHYVKATSIPVDLRREDYRTWYIAEGGDYKGPYVRIDASENNCYKIGVHSVEAYSIGLITAATIDLK